MSKARVRQYPYTLTLAMQDTHDKPDRRRGGQANLRQSRKRSAVTTRQRHGVLNMLKRIGLK